VPDPRFAGKVALVTGGTSGIGRAVAHGFARDGAAVVIAGRNAERGEAVRRELEEMGARALFVAADVSHPDDVEALVDRAVERFGRLDCATNNAAALDVGVFKATADFGDDEFDGHMTLNLKSVWLCLKHEIAQMLRQGGGTIVNTSSINALGGVPQNALYAAAKAAVLALTKSAALEYAKQGIRINALVAGAFRTPMLESVFERLSPSDTTAAHAGYAQMVPLGRIGQPEEAAEAVLWLCSEAASYVTGHSMIVDGGVTAPYR
jgi:NAD(P)-dependent dehydrogenase (short-subunit alcohol dehydrogenase family)